MGRGGVDLQVRRDRGGSVGMGRLEDGQGEGPGRTTREDEWLMQNARIIGPQMDFFFCTARIPLTRHDCEANHTYRVSVQERMQCGGCEKEAR